MNIKHPSDVPPTSTRFVVCLFAVVLWLAVDALALQNAIPASRSIKPSKENIHEGRNMHSIHANVGFTVNINAIDHALLSMSVLPSASNPVDKPVRMLHVSRSALRHALLAWSPVLGVLLRSMVLPMKPN